MHATNTTRFPTFFLRPTFAKKEGENASSFLSFPHNSRLKNRVKRNSIFSLLSSPHAGRRRHVRWKRRKRRRRRRRNILIGAEANKARHVVQCGFRQRCVKSMKSNTKQFIGYFFYHLDLSRFHTVRIRIGEFACFCVCRRCCVRVPVLLIDEEKEEEAAFGDTK